MKYIGFCALFAGFVILCLITISMAGAGSLKGRLTLSGVYSVCKPEGYPALCFVNKQSGAISCELYTGPCN